MLPPTDCSGSSNGGSGGTSISGSTSDAPSESNGGDAATVVLDPCDVEIWLNSHPEFVSDYLVRHATPAMFDAWRTTSATGYSASLMTSTVGEVVLPHDGPPSLCTSSGFASVGDILTSSSSLGDTSTNSSNNSRASSGANTPVRKVSAQEFEKRGQTLKPMVTTTVDGLTTFLDADAPQASIPSMLAESQSSERRLSELKSLDSSDLINELVLDICRDLDPASLGHKILQNVGLLLGADRCSLFIVERRPTPGDVSADHRCLVSRLFDVSANTGVDDCNRGEIVVAWGTGIVGHVAMTGNPLNIPDAYSVSVLLSLSYSLL
jgi:dual 3',5'-cyclic-AMP and -GMP phosphodiesterase 11